MGDAQCGAAGSCGHRRCCRISARRRSSDRNSLQSKRDRPVCCAVDHDGRLCADTGLRAGRRGLHDDGVSDCRPPPVHDRSACLGEGLVSARNVDDDRRRQHSFASVARHSTHRSVIVLWSRLSRFDRAVLVVFVLILIIAAIGPFVAPYPPTVADPLQRLVSPYGAHPFGTDENGIDVLSRLIAAPRTDVLIAVIATTLSVAIGAPLGAVAGYLEGAARRGFAVPLTAGLSGVGAGGRPPTSELGAMIASGAKVMITGQWWVAMFPGLLLGLIVFTFAAIGDIVGKLMEPGQRAMPSRRLLANARIGPAAQAEAAAPSAQDAVLSVRGLAIEASGRPPILDGVSFDLMPGEILGVVGLPGSGKSILVRAILSLLGHGLQRRAGHVFFRGKDLAELDEKTLRAIRGCEILPLLPNAKSQLNPLVRVGDLMVAHSRAHVPRSRREART